MAHVKGQPTPFLHLDTIINDKGYEAAAYIASYGFVQHLEMGHLDAEVVLLTFKAWF